MCLVQKKEIYYKIKHVLLKTKRKNLAKTAKGKSLRGTTYAVSYDLAVQTVFVTMALLHVYTAKHFSLWVYI